jgi:hypothetical protein
MTVLMTQDNGTLVKREEDRGRRERGEEGRGGDTQVHVVGW